jgi:hypothetical protein
MVRSHEELGQRNSHPYWYGRIVTVFHANVRHIGPTSKSSEIHHMEFLWVRWFGRNMDFRAGWKAKRLHRLGFVPCEDPMAFGFLDPKEIIRGVHIIPAFHHGLTAELLPPDSIGRPAPFFRQPQGARQAYRQAATQPAPRRHLGRASSPIRAYDAVKDMDYVYYYVNV